MPIALLLAMQAAGMIIDWTASRNQQRLTDIGSNVEQAGIEANIQQTRLEAEESSLQSMQALRKNLGTQIATYAARGTALGAGSSLASITESVSNFNADERTRRMNLMSQENSLKSGAAIKRLQNMSESSKLWQGFASRTFNRFPSSYAVWKQGIADIKEGFGLTKAAG